MARLLENDSKQILAKHKITVPRFQVAATPDEAKDAAEVLGGPVVLKALVPVGKRGKAGAIKFADDIFETMNKAKELLGTTVRNYPVEKILVEEKIDIDQELYVSIAIDKMARMPVILASSAGGMDIEEISAKYPSKIKIARLDPYKGLPNFKAKEIWADLGLTGSVLREATSILIKLYQIFTRYDCTILEINPLVITKEAKICAAASVMAVDDSAMYRHPELNDYVQMGSERSWRPLTPLEKEIVEVNEADPYRGTARYTEIDGGDIGFMCGGGGGSLLMFDTLLSYGGKPANYTEFGGNPPERKVYGLVKGILSKPGVKGLLVSANITNNTQVDIVAQGIVRALQDKKIDPQTFPVVVRLAGVNDAAGRQIFESAGVEYYGEDITMTAAGKKMVEKMKKAYAG